jgi:hypothetical protein
MVGMRSVVVDKLASVTQACGLSHEVRVAAQIPAEEGVMVVIEVLNNKTTYNTLELTSAMVVGKGDIVAGALGHRKALFGYSGHVPESLQPGDVIQMLNIGGVLGICDSINPDKGKPFDCRVLGVALNFPYLGERIGVPARVGVKRLDANARLDTRGVPVVALAGTCMEAGKTAAACAIISRMRHRGLTVDAFKATGVSLRRDILAMEDAGARHCAIFTDLGIVTTTRANGPALTRTMLTELAAGKPDVMVFELGDGILGTYGVDAILECPDIRAALSGVILSANDPVAAWGGVAAARALRHRAVRGDGALDRQPGRGRDHHQPDGRARLQRPEQRRRARGPGDRGAGTEGRGAAVSEQIPAVVLGGTGYVAGELLRLIAGHSRFLLAAVLSDSQPGDPLAGAFPHLAAAYADTRFSSQAQVQQILCESRRRRVLAAPTAPGPSSMPR